MRDEAATDGTGAAGTTEPAREPLVQRLIRRGLRRAITYTNSRSGQFITVHERPKRAALVDAAPVARLQHGPAAIVMQGPVMQEDGFTLETLRLYARRMPECRLVLSTWDDTDPALLAPIRAEGVEVVLSPKPAIPGLFNINLQLESARAGVRHAVAAGAEWVLKTRTDQRLYAPEAIAALVAMAETFPPASGARQRRRIVGVGQGSLMFAPYHVTDQTVFGHAEEMAIYFDAPPREDPPPAHWPKTSAEIFARVPVGELCRLGAAETYLASSFLTRIGRPLDWTLEDSWAAYRDHFCFADQTVTDFLWIKGQSLSLREYMTQYVGDANRREMAFGPWLMLHRGLLPVEAARPYEGLLASPFIPFAPPW